MAGAADVPAAAGAEPFAAGSGGVRLVVRATPRARASFIEGVGHDAEGRPMLLVRLAAPPVDGAANAALVAVVAHWLGLRKSDVTIEAGETQRTKRLWLRGDPAPLLEQLRRAVGAAGKASGAG